MRLVYSLLAAFLFVTTQAQAATVTVIDQDALIPTNAAQDGANSLLTVGPFTGPFEQLQTFTVGKSGSFVGVNLQLFASTSMPTNPNFDLMVSIVEISGFTTIGATRATSTLARASVTSSDLENPSLVSVSFASFAVNAGDNLGILLKAPDTNGVVGSYGLPITINNLTSNYSGGQLFTSFGGGPFAFQPPNPDGSTPSLDLGFQTLVEMEMPAIPLPASAFLLVAGLGGLCLMRKRG